jgi:hypothetical protein
LYSQFRRIFKPVFLGAYPLEIPAWNFYTHFLACPAALPSAGVWAAMPGDGRERLLFAPGAKHVRRASSD